MTSLLARAFFVVCSLVPALALAQDVSVIAIREPVDGCGLGSSESVTVQVFNYGPTLPAGTAFGIAYSVDAGAPVSELVVLGSNLLSNSRFGYTFTTPADLSVPGSHALDATVNLAGDVNPTNDAYVGYAVTNSAPSVGGSVGGPVSPASSGTLTLAGQTGNVVQWEESTDGGLRWFVLANTATTQDFAALRTPTSFRARVRSGSCADAVSTIKTVTP